MKLREVAEVIKGAYLLEGKANENKRQYQELSMISLEPISFLDERKIITVNSNTKYQANS